MKMTLKCLMVISLIQYGIAIPFKYVFVLKILNVTELSISFPQNVHDCFLVNSTSPFIRGVVKDKIRKPDASCLFCLYKVALVSSIQIVKSQAFIKPFQKQCEF